MPLLPLYIVFCESTQNRVGFVQYIRAGSEEAAKTAAVAPGVQCLSARVLDDSGEWMADSANRTQLGLAAANDGLRSTRSLLGNRHVFWTVFLAVMAAMLCWTLLSWLIGILFLLLSQAR